MHHCLLQMKKDYFSHAHLTMTDLAILTLDGACIKRVSLRFKIPKSFLA